VPFFLGSRPKPAIGLPYGEIPKQMVPKMFRSHKWAQASLLLDKVKSGEMSEEEYKRVIGWRAANVQIEIEGGGSRGGATGFQGVFRVTEDQAGAKEAVPLPNPKMLMWGTYFGPGTNILNNTADNIGDVLKALDRMEFVVWAGTHMTPAARYADLVLPLADMTLETRNIGGSVYGGFSNITFLPGVVPPQGEAKPDEWVYSELAWRLGVGEQYNRYYKPGDNWDEAWERYLKDEYQRASDELRAEGREVPDWESFTKRALINVDEYHDEPWHGYKDYIAGGKPFQTRSGQIEIFSYAAADESQRGQFQVDDYGRVLDNLPNDWRDLPPLPEYQKMYRGMDHPDVKRFPLFMMTSYPRYRLHSTFWNVPWMRGDCYRHALWISQADAQSRGIRDGDLALARNDKGRAILPAYVTPRLLPGVVVIHHGGWFQPDGQGVDWGCTPNTFITDPESPVTAPLVTNLVQVERYEGPVPDWVRDAHAEWAWSQPPGRSDRSSEPQRK